MSTVLIPYSKLYLLQRLLVFMVGGLIVLLVIAGIGVNVYTILLPVFLLVSWYPERNLLAVWKGERPAILVSEEGFIDYIHSYHTGVIPWTAVKAVEQYGFFFKRQIRITLHEPKQLLEQKKSIFTKWTIRKAIFLHQTPYCWDNRMLGISQQEVLKLLQEVKDRTYDFNNFGQHLIEQ